MLQTESRIFAVAMIPLLLPTVAWTAPVSPSSPRPAVFEKLMACRMITIASERLACFDRESMAVDNAERNRDVVVVDRSQVRAARRTLFGLSLPSLVLFGGDSDPATPDGRAEAEEAQQIDSVIGSARQNAIGRWIVLLEDGARWVQIDTRTLSADPKAGQKIRIRRAAMGSYLANIDGQIAIRVRREN